MYMIFFNPVVIILAIVAIVFIYGICTTFKKEE